MKITSRFISILAGSSLLLAVLAASYATGEQARGDGASTKPAAAAAASDPAAKALAQQILASMTTQKGLCVHLGCGDGKLAAEIAQQGLLVHGLAINREQLASARKYIEARGLAGAATVDTCSMTRLPYASNLASLIVADDLPGVLAGGLTLQEAVRVLAPGGVAYIGRAAGGKPALTEEDLRAKLSAAGIKDFKIIQTGGIWAVFSKPRPAEMDDWTHERHGVDGNFVSKDKLGVPSMIRWMGGFPWSKVYFTPTLAMVSAEGRNFYLCMGDGDYPGNKTGDQLSLVARDSYNGLVLWEREWVGRVGRVGRELRYRAGSPNKQAVYGEAWAPLAAVGDRVYTLLEDKAVAIDAATGKTVVTYDIGDSLPQEMVCHEGALIVATSKGLRVFEARSGNLKWKTDWEAADVIIGEGKAFVLDVHQEPFELVSLSLDAGKEQWRKSTDKWMSWSAEYLARYRKKDYSWVNPRILKLDFYQAGILALTEGYGGLHVVSAKDGEQLWHYDLVQSAAFINGLVCANQIVDPTGWMGRKGFLWLDPASGEVKKRSNADSLGLNCQRAIFTEKYFISSKWMGMYNLETDKMEPYGGSRSGCMLNALPANGLLNVTPHGCLCNFSRKLKSSGSNWGYEGLATAEDVLPAQAGEVLEQGPAYGFKIKTSEQTPSATTRPIAADAEGDWPSYRHDSRRSATAKTAVPADCKLLWEKQVAQRPTGSLSKEWANNPLACDPLTPLVIADGKVFAALPDEHRVVAMDATSGKPLWSYTAGGRVVVPPTIYGGLCLFGSCDGWTYCLRASDGELVWRFRAAPSEHLIVAFGQLESSWPVIGGVTMANGLAYCAAGRSGWSDGGMTVYALDPQSGKTVLKMNPKNFQGLNEVFAVDGNCLYQPGHPDWDMDLASGQEGSIRKSAADGKSIEEHPRLRTESIAKGSIMGLRTRTGMLRGLVNRHPIAGFNSATDWWYGEIRAHVMIFDETKAYGFHRTNLKWAAVDSPGVIFAQNLSAAAGAEPLWSLDVPFPATIESMALCGGTLFVGGPADVKDRETKGGMIWAMTASDGKKAGEIKLGSPPLFDGLAAANGRLYVCTQDGKVLCFGKE